jgi:Fe-S cluster assembly protein SufB
LLLDEHSRSDAYPTIRISEDNVKVGHDPSVSKVGYDRLFYLISHGIREDEASDANCQRIRRADHQAASHAVEMNRLVELQMEGSTA